MKHSPGMLRPHGAGGNGQGRQGGGGVPLRAEGARELPSPPTRFPRPDFSSTTTGTGAGAWQRCFCPVPGFVRGWGKPPAPHPALLSQHPGLAKPGGSLLGSRPGADLLAAPGSGILHAAALVPATPLLRAPVTRSVPIPSLGPPRCHRSMGMGCGPQRDLVVPTAAQRSRGGRRGGNPICPPSPGPPAEGGRIPFREHAPATTFPTELPPAIPGRGAAM